MMTQWEKGRGLQSLEQTIKAKELKESGSEWLNEFGVTEVGPRLKAVRMARGKGIDVVAAAVGITAERLARIEQGADFNFTPALAEKIAFNLGLVKKLTLQQEEVPAMKSAPSPNGNLFKPNGASSPNHLTRWTSDMTDLEKRRAGADLKRRREEAGATRSAIERMAALPKGGLWHCEEGRYLSRDRVRAIGDAIAKYDPTQEKPRGGPRKPRGKNKTAGTPPPTVIHRDLDQAAVRAIEKPERAQNEEPTPFEMVTTREIKLSGDGFEIIASIGSKAWTFSISDSKDMLVFDSKAQDKYGIIEALKQMVKAIESA